MPDRSHPALPFRDARPDSIESPPASVAGSSADRPPAAPSSPLVGNLAPVQSGRTRKPPVRRRRRSVGAGPVDRPHVLSERRQSRVRDPRCEGSAGVRRGSQPAPRGQLRRREDAGGDSADARSASRAHLGWIEAQLSDGQTWLLGDFSLADVSAYMNVWYVRSSLVSTQDQAVRSARETGARSRG
jgi:hypothetical protein